MCRLEPLLEQRQDDYTLKVFADPDPFDPWREWDNASVFACVHRRYNLGDDDGMSLLRGAIADSLERRRRYAKAREVEGYSPPELAEALAACPDIVWLPLYLYDHSGITMSTDPFCDPWDSGQVGIAFMTRAAILEQFGGKLLTPSLRSQALRVIEAEVTIYDEYLNGQVYGWAIENASSEQVDACWGYFGQEHAIEEGEAALSHLARTVRGVLQHVPGNA